MHYRKLGRTGLKVSEICLGTMQFGWTADEDASRKVMDAFMEADANFIDTADIYTNWVGNRSHSGNTEEIIGRWIKDRGNRDKIILATKVGGPMSSAPNDGGLSRQHVIEGMEASLRRLQTDYVDLYQAHWVDLNTQIDETLRAFDDLVRSGKVRYLGASNFPAWRLMQAQAASDRLNLHRFESYQPQYSLMERQLFEYEAMVFCKHYQVAIIPYSPLAEGFLTGKYRRGGTVASDRAEGVNKAYANEKGWAVIDALERIGKSHNKSITQTSLAWLLTNPLMTAPIIGANTVAQLQDSLGAAGYRLSAEEMKELNDLTAWPRNWRPVWD